MNKSSRSFKKIATLPYEVGSLRKIARSHRQSFLTDDLSDNIASHSYRVSVIGYFLAEAENADIAKVLTMCLFHDLNESRSGDQNWIHKRYVKVFEEEITSDQLSNLTEKDELLAIMTEYNKRESLEAQLAKDADRLDQVLLNREYAHVGNTEAQRWAKHPKQDLFFSQTAKELYQDIVATKPNSWWNSIWTEKRRE